MIQTELISLPLSLHRGTGFVIVAFAVFMVAAHTGIAALAAQRTSLSLKEKVVVPFVIGAFLASWFARRNCCRRWVEFPHCGGISASDQRIGGADSIPHCARRAVRVQINPRDQCGNTELLAHRGSDLPRRRDHVYLPFSDLRNRAGRLRLARGNWRCPDWDLRASCGVNGRAKPTECFQMGGSLECFRHARPDCRSRHCALFSVAGSCSLSARAGSSLPGTATGNSDPHLLV